MKRKILTIKKYLKFELFLQVFVVQPKLVKTNSKKHRLKKCKHISTNKNNSSSICSFNKANSVHFHLRVNLVRKRRSTRNYLKSYTRLFPPPFPKKLPANVSHLLHRFSPFTFVLSDNKTMTKYRQVLA